MFFYYSLLIFTLHDKMDNKKYRAALGINIMGITDPAVERFARR